MVIKGNAEPGKPGVERFTPEQFRALAISPKRNKFGARKTPVDGIQFHSKAESIRYAELRLLERSGEITNLELQPRFPCTVGGALVCTWVGDFSYFSRPTNTKRGEYVVEDVKGFKTALYKLKKRLVEACYPGTRIIEVRA